MAVPARQVLDEACCEAPECRVLIVRYLSYVQGGIESYLNGLMPGLIEAGVHPTILTMGVFSETQRNYLASLGVGLIEARLLGQDRPSRGLSDRLRLRHAQRLFVRKVLADGCFDAIHINTSAPGIQALLLQEARRAGVAVRISHGHDELASERGYAALTHRWYAHTIGRLATQKLACSDVAGRYLYGPALWERVGEVSNNGIDTEAFSFDPVVRERLRAADPTAFVVGNVARLSNEKNQGFLLSVFAELARCRPQARLWLVGTGADLELLQNQAHELGIDELVTFWGYREDARDLLQAMDCFVLPSLHEGLPLSLLEAQAAGLPCVVSSNVTASAAVPGCTFTRLPLDVPHAEWVRMLASCEGVRTPEAHALVRAAGFDCHDRAREMAVRYRGQVPPGPS